MKKLVPLLLAISFAMPLPAFAVSQYDPKITLPTPSPTSMTIAQFSCLQVVQVEMKMEKDFASNNYSDVISEANTVIDRDNLCPNIEYELGGIALTIKATAEHILSNGDARTDLNQAIMVLSECIQHMYGTKDAARCDTMQDDDYRLAVKWEYE